MITLADVNDVNDSGPALSDFNPIPMIGSVLNAATVNNAASHAALLSPPERVIPTFGIVSTELANGQSSPTLQTILNKNQTADQGSLYNELQGIMNDPSIPVEEKAQYVDGYINNSTPTPGGRSLAQMVAERAMSDSTGADETDETVETTLFDLSTTLDEADTYRGWVQKEINFKTNIQNRQWYDWAADFAENLIPFMDQAANAKTQLARGDVGMALKAMFLTGDSKAEIRDALARMPLDQRMKAAESLIEMVKNSNGSLLPRANTLQMVNQLNAYLVGGNYQDGDQLIDNIFSVMDAALPFLSGIGKLGKSARAAADIERATNVAAKAKKMEGIVEETLTAAVPVEKAFDADETTIAGVKQLVHDKISDSLLKQGSDAPYEQIDDLLKKVDEIITAPNLTNPKKLASDITTVIHPILTKGTKKTSTVAEFKKYIEEESNTNRLMVRAIEDYHSIAATFRESSPSKARALNNMIEASSGNDSARAAYGTTRTEAIVNDRAPEVGNIDKTVRVKVEMDEAGPSPDTATIASIKKDRGRTDLSPQEKASARGAVIDAFQNVNGLVPRKTMGTVDENTYIETPTGASFNMVYGPKDGGFAVATDGLYQVLQGLKKYGVTGKDIEVLARDTDGKYHVLTAPTSARGNYLIRVKHDYEFGPSDVVWQTLESDKNYRMFESRSSITDGNAGGLLQHFVPSSAIIDKVIYNSASVASDRSARIQKQLIKLATEYADVYKKLSPRQKLLVDAYRVEANTKGIPFSEVNLKARGFDNNAIEAMRKWKTTTDTMWWLENVDLNKSLRGLGWERFVDQVNDTDLIARRVSNRGLVIAKVYDPVTNTIKQIDQRELQELYDKNGTLAQFKRPLNVGDDEAEYVIVKDGGSGFLRRIRDEDTTLPYRDGYYPIKYNAPIFIRKKFAKKGGGYYYKAIATAGNHGDANALLSRLRNTDQEGEYILTGDYKRGSADFHDAEWDVVVSSGRSAQRVRGQRLADASSPTDLSHLHVESPEDSLISSIKSIASRTAFRDWMDSSKQRWLATYGHLIDSDNPNQFPTSAKQIGSRNLEDSNRLVKDAKANWRFIHSMENGFTNILDDASKNFFANFADTASRNGWSWLEKPAQALAKGSPSAFARKKAFRLLLAANPLRQLPVQSMQALPILLATNPLAIPKVATQMILLDYLANGGDAASFMKVMARAATGMDYKAAKKLAEDWEASGFEAAVDAHTLIRDQLSSLVDRTPWKKANTILGKPLDVLQKIGFNKGEQILMRSVWLSEYDLLRKSGKVIDAEALENLNARVRNLTLNMNRAGEMPYNENLFSSAMQFFQAPHKAFGQIILGHKGLSASDRWRLGASYIATYGIGGGFLTDLIMQGFQGDEQTRDVIEGGLFNLSLNSALRVMMKDETNVDFSDSLRLLPQPDIFKVWNGLMTADIAELLSTSPSASLIFGGNPRVTNFINSMMRPFTLDNSDDPATFQLVGKNFADMFSGASNFFKAKYALEHGKQMSNKGAVMPGEVTPTEALGKLMGFSTVDEIHYYASQEEVYKKTQKYKDDVKRVVDEVSSRLADQSISADQQGWYLKMMSEAQRVFGNDPLYMKEFSDQIRYKAANGEYSIYNTLRRLAGTMDSGEFDAMVDRANITEQMKNTLKQSKKFWEAD